MGSGDGGETVGAKVTLPRGEWVMGNGYPPIQVIGLGLGGTADLSELVRQRIENADVLVGSARHLALFPDHPAQRWVIGNLSAILEKLKTILATAPYPHIVVLTSGDPLFFGLGRLLVSSLPAEQLDFHPSLSSVQLALNRLKIPWQDARIVSIHGRSWQPLIAALQRSEPKIAVLNDPSYPVSAIATLIRDLALPGTYKIWVCENLGGPEERIRCFSAEALDASVRVAPLNVVVLLRQPEILPTGQFASSVPLLGIPDASFHSFPDRPGLMTKREVRVLALAELALAPNQIIWDIGAGTGSVSIEMARLTPSSQIYAIEKTAAGGQLIAQNCRRFEVANIQVIQGSAPGATASLPAPDRVFIGGSGGQLETLLDQVSERLRDDGCVVLSLATLESMTQLKAWLTASRWQARFLQVNLARSTAVGAHTRFTPLNPLSLAILRRERQT
ncbi:MAG: precorrin-6y C5,15-methyltransferase (decarboxylating) subunit CbiE [Cyanobacteria bacterium P01_D01_bin.44]